MATIPYLCSSAPLNSADLDAAQQALGVEATLVWTILEVESGKAGYLPDRRPPILFERAYFHRLTNGAYDATHPGISAPTGGGYSGGTAEYARLAEAYALNPNAALQSASWGIAQIMGSNFSLAGYTSVEDYVQDVCASEGAQLRAFWNFLLHDGIAPSLQAQDWDTVARKYNGPGNVAVYSAKLSASYTLLQDPANLPDLAVRAAQLYLTFLAKALGNPAFGPGGVDGILGTPGHSHTLAALNAFLTAQGLAATTTVDDGVLASLAAALPAAGNLTLG